MSRDRRDDPEDEQIARMRVAAEPLLDQELSDVSA
jgi:hypothetical protein